MAGTLEGKKIAFLVANEGVEQVELTEPWAEARRQGAQTDLIAPDAGEVQAFNHLDKADTFDVDETVDSADVPLALTASLVTAALNRSCTLPVISASRSSVTAGDDFAWVGQP